ncbi:MAG: PCRF domain-containing protein, partial [Bdellovibrionota bacterium]
MLAQLAKIERRFLEVESLLAHPDVISNQNEFRKLSKERSELEEIVDVYKDFKKIELDTKNTEELYQEASGE